jgi:hypothetical protein
VTSRNINRHPSTGLPQAIVEAVVPWPHDAERLREALLPAHRLKDSSVRTAAPTRGTWLCANRLDGNTFVQEATMTDAGGGAQRAAISDRCLAPAEIARLAHEIGHAKKRKHGRAGART